MLLFVAFVCLSVLPSTIAHPTKRQPDTNVTENVSITDVKTNNSSTDKMLSKLAWKVYDGLESIAGEHANTTGDSGELMNIVLGEGTQLEHVSGINNDLRSLLEVLYIKGSVDIMKSRLITMFIALKKDFEDLKSEVRSLRLDSFMRLDGVLKNMKNIPADVSSLKSELNALKADVNSVKSGVKSSETQLKSANAALKVQIDVVKADTKAMKVDIQQMSEEIEEGATGATRPTQCASGWVKFKNNCFKFIYTPKRGDDARSDCQSMGAELPTVRTREIQDFLVNRMNSQNWLWTGLRGEGGSWTWPDGSSVDSGYSNMAPGQPSRSSGCVDIKKADNLWRAFPCNSGVSMYVCEKAL